MTQKISEQDNIAKWRELIGKFNALIKEYPKPKSIEKELLELRNEAKTTGLLNMRQVEAIIARCDNYLNGTYGNTKRPEHYEQSKSDKTK